MASSEPRIHACPTEAELRRYHAKEFSEGDEAGIREHLEACSACAARAAALLTEHDTWIARVRAAKSAIEDVIKKPPLRPAGLSGGDIAGYEILEELSRGGQGIVFRALQRSTKREVALKILREGSYASSAARRRFEREIELVASLSHPHIVTVFDSGETADGRKYFAMDYVRGQPLGRFVAASRASPAEKLRLFSRICQAVNYAHQRGVIHRDLKPSNILVDEAGEPHVLDFGLARQVARGDAMTTTGQVAGTLPYMSPEQARGMPDAVDVRSDVYALGVMLYELLTGTYPYPVEGDTIQVLKHIAETPPERPSRVWRRSRDLGESWRGPGKPRRFDELETIVLKALAKERAQRYQTAGELARDIDHYLLGEPIEARRDSGWYMLRKALYRYRIAAGIVAAFAVLITTSAVVFAVMYATQTRLRAEAEHQADLARQAEAKVRQHLGQIRELANDFVFGVDGHIKQLPGAAPARQWAVEKGLAYLEALATEAQDDLYQQRYLAGAYMTIGDVQGEPDVSSLGDLNGALASYRKAAEILESIAAREPDSVPVLDGLVLNYVKIGDAHAVLGEEDAALASFRRAIDLGRRGLALDPRRMTLRTNLASAYERLGLVLRDQGQTDAALEHFEEYLRIVREVAAGHPEDLWMQRAVAVAHLHIAEVRYEQGQLADALQGYREFLAQARELLAAHPRDIVARHDVAVACQWIGIIHTDQGEPELAIKSLRESAAVLEDWLGDDPRDEAAQTELATTRLKLGEAHLAAGQSDAARASFQRALELCETVLSGGSQRADLLQFKGDACQRMAELELALAESEGGLLDARIQHWEAARAWLGQRREVLVSMRERGILTASGAEALEELAREIERCDRTLEELRVSQPVRRGNGSGPD
jgi:tetratricopeptide (TPR) repeat protein